MKTIIRNITIVNENRQTVADVMISGERIEKIDSSISVNPRENIAEINGEGLHLLPGLIDDQVHFREPGLTHKADIHSESVAAVAGGITSFMDMPNTIPHTLTRELLEDKYNIAANKSVANFSFFMGINQHNLEEALKTDTEKVCGITDDGLYFNDEEGILANYPEFLDKLFSRCDTLVALHSEDDSIIGTNTKKYRALYGEDIPPQFHSAVRSREACITATERVLAIAKKHGNRLHFFHISTAEEAMMFDNTTSAREKRITAEACVHHLFFNEQDYEKLGNKIKWNPSVKTLNDNNTLLQALMNDRLDIIATDHAPHSIEEKQGNYFNAKSGGPLVQHALPALLELHHRGKISLEKIVEKTSHHVAEIYRIRERGYIREGYFADLVITDLNRPWTVDADNLLYKCRWSPFENYAFKSSVVKTFVNGLQVYDEGVINESCRGKRLRFEKIR